MAEGQRIADEAMNDPAYLRSEEANALLAAGLPADALPVARDAVRLAPADSAQRITLAIALSRTGNRPQASAELEKAVRLHNQGDSLLSLIGAAYELGGGGLLSEIAHRTFRDEASYLHIELACPGLDLAELDMDTADRVRSARAGKIEKDRRDANEAARFWAGVTSERLRHEEAIRSEKAAREASALVAQQEWNRKFETRRKIKIAAIGLSGGSALLFLAVFIRQPSAEVWLASGGLAGVASAGHVYLTESEKRLTAIVGAVALGFALPPLVALVSFFELFKIRY